MSTLAKEFLPVKVQVGDREFSLKPLSNYDRIELMNDRDNERRAALIKRLESSGIKKGADYFATIDQFDHLIETTPINAQWADYTNAKTDYQVILRSLKKSVAGDVEAAELAKQVTITFREKAQICGVEMAKEPAEKDEAEGNDPGEPGDRPMTYGSGPSDQPSETTEPNG